MWSDAVLLFRNKRQDECGYKVDFYRSYPGMRVSGGILYGISVRHQIFLSEEGMAEVTVYGRVKEIAWTEAKAVLPPGMIRSSYILLSDHGDKVAYPKEKNLRDRFLMETGKRTGLGTEFLKKKTILGRK